MCGRLDHVQFIFLAIEDITDRKQAEAALQQAHDTLEFKVQERTRELTATNLKLQAEITQRVQAEAQARQLAAQLTRSSRNADASPRFCMTIYNNSMAFRSG